MDLSDVENQRLKRSGTPTIQKKTFTPLPAFQEIRDKMTDFYAKVENSEKYYQELQNLISKSTGVDLTHYRSNYLHRRFYYRMLRLNVNSYREYLDYIKNHPEEAQLFIISFTIHVTSFFRDDKPFDVLRSDLIPKIADLRNESRDKTIRILSAPCSTGEEPYSLAIIAEELRRSGVVKNPIEIYACDLDQKSLDFAQIGVYNISCLKSVCEDELDRYFIQRSADSYQIKPHLKSYINFFTHDLLKPLPYQNFDLICCRNFLIYISKDRQQVVLNNLMDSFRGNGFLMLGKTEGFPLLSSQSFGAENLKEHIYFYKGVKNPYPEVTH
jgi:chemotaxis methyl-accepting protein methylase